MYLENGVKAALYPPGWFPGIPVVPFFHWMSLVDSSYGVPEMLCTISGNNTMHWRTSKVVVKRRVFEGNKEKNVVVSVIATSEPYGTAISSATKLPDINHSKLCK
ncbi:hypothetical protein DICVIV_12454 [Dictyocaulus viviparus]|uniref:Uncharacterized protein n=1 Tax=Dictyocaulus viviparus TaxID=29172 RepID=A0A0D8XAG8_DICVI|nr:hypothetical protein DICVIV_12454 [Dictyocaulus viviparus]